MIRGLPDRLITGVLSHLATGWGEGAITEVVFDEVNDRGQVFGDRLKNLVTETDLAVNPKNLAPFVDN